MKSFTKILFFFLALTQICFAQNGWFQQTSGTTNSLTGVSFIDANNGWAVGFSGTILRTTDGGKNWISQASGIYDDLYRVSFTDANNGTAVGDSGIILRTTNGGENWISQVSGTTIGLLGVSFTDANNGTVVGLGGTILRTTDGGESWVSQRSVITDDLFGVSFTDVNNGTVVGDSGIILRTTNGGENWISQVSGTTIGLLGVSFTDANNGTAIGLGGTILRTTNGGENWISQMSGTTNVLYLFGVSFTDANNGTVVGDSGIILRTTNGGESWASQISGTSNWLLGVSFTDSNNGTAVGEFGTILRTAALTVDPPNQNVSYSAGNKTFTVTSNISWTVSDDANWLTVSPDSGSNNGTLTANYTENTTTSQRTGTITVTGGGIIQQVTVTQAAGPAVLTVTPPNQTVPNASGSTTFSVTSNVTWTASDDAAWLTISPTSGNNNVTLTATYTENTTASQRTGTITVTGGGLTKTITVTQAAGPAVLTVTPLNQSVTYASGDTTFAVTSNVSWTVSDDADWLTVSPLEGTGNGTLTATYTENPTTSQRTGTITVTGGGITRTVTVIQEANQAVLTVTPPNQSVTYASGDTRFAVISNVSWTVGDDVDWLTVSPPEGTGNGTLTATYTENTTASQRTGTITVTGGGITQQVTVIQAGTPTLHTVPNSLSFGDVIVGINSTPQSYVLTGSSLLSDVTITAPSGFTLSTSQLGIYTDTITVPWSDETFNTTIWVKFNPTQVQQYTGNILNTATGIVINILVEGVGISYPGQIPVNVSYSFPNFSSNKNYQIIGLPGEIDFSLKNIMPEQQYNWRAFWDPGPGDYIEYDETDLFNFRPGRAFWLISRYQINIVDTFNTVSLEMDNSYSISVHSEWNLISNPFDKNISWQDVKSANPELGEPIYYFHLGDYDSAEVFEKYKGYYFYNNPSLNMEILKIPYISFDNSIPKASNQVNARNELEILLSEKNISLISLTVGYMEKANPGVDSYDKFSPPAGFCEINFAIYNKELETNYKYLRKDIRPAIGEGQDYDLVVKNTSDKTLAFTTLGLENFENYMVYILDKSTMKLYDLRKQNRFEVKKNTSEKHFSLFIGTEEYIIGKKKSLIPVEYTLYQNYPNPFNPSTTIMYALPNQSKVSLNVYNVLGELIIVLINNELQEAGYHQVMFKSNSLSSGVYIYKLIAGDYTYTKKMLIIK